MCTVYLCVRRCVMCCMYLCVCCGFLRAPSPSGIKQVPHTGSGGTTTHRRTDITRRLACQKTNPTQEDPNWAYLGVHQRFFLKKIVTTSCGGQDQNNSSKKEIKYRDSRSNHKRDRDRESSSLGRLDCCSDCIKKVKKMKSPVALLLFLILCPSSQAAPQQGISTWRNRKALKRNWYFLGIIPELVDPPLSTFRNKNVTFGQNSPIFKVKTMATKISLI